MHRFSCLYAGKSYLKFVFMKHVNHNDDVANIDSTLTFSIKQHTKSIALQGRFAYK